jgi:hypothetical protein
LESPQAFTSKKPMKIHGTEQYFQFQASVQFPMKIILGKVNIFFVMTQFFARFENGEIQNRLM